MVRTEYTNCLTTGLLGGQCRDGLLLDGAATPTGTASDPGGAIDPGHFEFRTGHYQGWTGIGLPTRLAAVGVFVGIAKIARRCATIR